MLLQFTYVCCLVVSIEYERNVKLSLSVHRMENTQTRSLRNMTIRVMASVLKALTFHTQFVAYGSDEKQQLLL
jgi:hypothetical protein